METVLTKISKSFMNKGNLYYDENNIEYGAVADQEQKVIRNWCD